VRLVRRGAAISSYRSADGTTWTLIGTETIPMAATVYAGLAVTGHTDSATATAAFTNVAVTVPAGNAAPTVSLTTPGNGASYTAPASIPLAATAADADGSIYRVDFYQGSTLLGSDTTAPYTFTWTNVAAGTYSMVAVAIDNLQAYSVSPVAGITVTGVATATKTLMFAPSADNDANVTSYTLEIFAAGQDPATARAAASQNLGKPAAVAGTVSVDITPLVAPLPAGSFIASVTAIGPGGSTRGAPSPAFVH
jgi:hypothetical protein